MTGDILTLYEYGGVGRYIVELAYALSKINVDVKIDSPLYINRYLRNYAKEISHNGIYLPTLIRRFLWRDGIRTRASRLVGRLSSNKAQAQVIHEMYYRHENLRGINGYKVASFYDMVHELFMPDQYALIAKKRKTADQVDHCIAISDATKRDMISLLGLKEEKITVIHLASDMCRTSSTVPALDKLEYICWIGNRAGYKNFSRFVDAFVISKASCSGLQIVCVGGPAPCSIEKQNWKSQGVDPDRIHYLKASDEVLARVYSHSTMLVYASMYEGFGLPPLEAMRCGCPVATSNTSSLPEVVGDAAELFDPTNKESISHAIDNVLSDFRRRSDMIDKGYRQAAKFSWEKCATNTLQIYRSAIEL